MEKALILLTPLVLLLKRIAEDPVHAPVIMDQQSWIDAVNDLSSSIYVEPWHNDDEVLS